jgi:hypothetical protein
MAELQAQACTLGYSQDHVAGLDWWWHMDMLVPRGQDGQPYAMPIGGRVVWGIDYYEINHEYRG